MKIINYKKLYKHKIIMKYFDKSLSSFRVYPQTKSLDCHWTYFISPFTENHPCRSYFCLKHYEKFVYGDITNQFIRQTRTSTLRLKFTAMQYDIEVIASLLLFYYCYICSISNDKITLAVKLCGQQRVVVLFMQAANSERDPRCLLKVFQLFNIIVRNLSLGLL